MTPLLAPNWPNQNEGKDLTSWFGWQLSPHSFCWSEQGSRQRADVNSSHRENRRKIRLRMKPCKQVPWWQLSPWFMPWLQLIAVLVFWSFDIINVLFIQDGLTSAVKISQPKVCKVFLWRVCLLAKTKILTTTDHHPVTRVLSFGLILCVLPTMLQLQNTKERLPELQKLWSRVPTSYHW